MAGVISRLANMKNVNFVIAGDGPKRTLLEEVREKHYIQDRVTLIGALEHSKVFFFFAFYTNNLYFKRIIFFSKVRDVLRSGHIFLNTSLTEAYCMAIVEAASCGLQVVSTRVGGIPEVLPPNLIHLTDATVDSLYNGLLITIKKLQNERKTLQTKNSKNGSVTIDSHSNCNGVTNYATNASTEAESKKNILCPYECNEMLRKLYNWNDITERTERVYQRVLREKDLPFGDKLNCYLNACIPFVLVVSFSYLLLRFLDIIEPRRYIDIAVEPNTSYSKRSKTKHM